jgi:hypothetical protein
MANLWILVLRDGTVELEHAPFQNYVVSIFRTSNMYRFFGAVVHNCDYCCTCDVAWTVHK